MRRLLITGGSGYLGRTLIARADGWEIHATSYRQECASTPDATIHRIDLRDPLETKRLVKRIEPDVILHTACSDRTAESIGAIVPAARHLAREASRNDARLIHLSTDMVFDGEGAPYAEEAGPTPLGEYGRNKAKAESIVSEDCQQSLIVRPSLIYGFDPPDHQSRWILAGMKSREPIRLFTDEIRSPIWVQTLADALLELAGGRLTGMLHLGSPRPVSRFELGMAILERLGREPTDNIAPSTIGESGLVRPRDLTLDVSRALALLDTPLPTVNDVCRRTR